MLKTCHSSCPYSVLVKKICEVSTLVINVIAGLEVKDKISGQLKSRIGIILPIVSIKSKRALL